MSAIEGLAKAMFEEAGDALFLLDPDTDELVDVNPMAEKLSGVPRQKLLTEPSSYWFHFGPPEGGHRLRRATTQSGIFHSQEGYYLRGESSWIPVNLTIARLHVQPKTLALITVRDVREQREAHARVEKAEAELRRVLDSVSDCLWSASLDTNGRWTYSYFSPVVARITGRPPDYFMSGLRRWESVVHTDDRPRWKASLNRLLTGQPGQEEYRVVWPDGAVRWVRDSIRPTREPGAKLLRLDGVLTEITARKQAEEEVKKVNAFLDSIVENVPIMLFVKDAEKLSFQLHNKAGEKLLGYDKADLLGKNDYDFFPREEADFFIAKDREVLNGKKMVDIPEEQVQTKNGVRILHTMKIPILDEQGNPRYLLGISEDITERKALEETRRQYAAARERYAQEVEAKNRALSESERRYRQLTEATLDAIIVADQQGVIRLFNPAAARLFGYEEAEVLGQPLTCLMPPEHREAYQQGLQCYLETGQAKVVGRTAEFAGLRKDGTQFPLEVALSALQADGGVRFLGAIRDLTERNRMRTFLFQNEKLASIGRLSAGVAHEINNPLAYVANNLVVLDRDVRGLFRVVEAYEAAAGDSAPQAQATAAEVDLPYIRENLDRLLTRTRAGVDRVTRIVQSLRGYARTAPAARQEAHIPDLLESSLEILQGQLRRRRIEVQRDYGDSPKVRCSTTDMNQVLLNLLVNACQAIEAMPPEHAGRLRVATRQVGEELVTEVCDSGCGITPENRARLFDPFFTTKPVGEGTGLGLWISHTIVTAHGGRLEVDSQPGQGTCFRVILPLQPPPSS